MKDQYFVVDFGHSEHGSLKKICVPHRYVYFTCLGLLIAGLFGTGLFLSYARMWWKVSSFNTLRAENYKLKEQYQGLRKQNLQATRQLASFQMLASEISMAYGLTGTSGSVMSGSLNDPLLPTIGQSFEEFKSLREAELAQFNRRGYSTLSLPIETPTYWPVLGRLSSHFGSRMDPFSGEGAFHTGVDIQSTYDAPARVTANGVVVRADYYGGYGNVVVIDHGNGFQTLYGHLQRFAVIPGQQVRRGQVVGYCGSTGRSTGIHLHYEVRRGNVPINPYPYMAKTFGGSTTRDFNF